MEDKVIPSIESGQSLLLELGKTLGVINQYESARRYSTCHTYIGHGA